MFVNIRSRLTFLFSLSVLGLLTIYSGSLYLLYRQEAYRDLDKSLRNDLETAEMALEQHVLDNGPGLTVQTDVSNWLTEIWDEKGNRIYTSGASDEFPLGKFENDCRNGSITRTLSTSGSKTRVHCMTSEAFPGKYYVRVSRLTDKTDSNLDNFLFLMSLGVPFVVFMSSGAGYLLARRALSPIFGIVEKAKRISAENLSERIQTPNPQDEIGQLASTFNQMFGRLENSFEQMKRFSSDASHELRTPLAAIRTMGEVALRGPETAAAHREVLSDILVETARLQKLCEALLTLSKAEGTGLELKREQTNLKVFIEDIVELLGILAEDKNVHLETVVPLEIHMTFDPMWLRQAFVNVIDNAIKFSPEGGTVCIQATFDSSNIVISVEDEGSGIPQEMSEKVFERFVRLEADRGRSTGGAGLGLAIAKTIVKAHGGSIQILPRVSKGTLVQFHFRRT